MTLVTVRQRRRLSRRRPRRPTPAIVHRFPADVDLADAMRQRQIRFVMKILYYGFLQRIDRMVYPLGIVSILYMPDVAFLFTVTRACNAGTVWKIVETDARDAPLTKERALERVDDEAVTALYDCMFGDDLVDSVTFVGSL